MQDINRLNKEGVNCISHKAGRKNSDRKGNEDIAMTAIAHTLIQLEPSSSSSYMELE